MNLTIRIIIMVLVLLFVGHTRINFFPFKIDILYWRTSLGVLLLIIGLILVSYDSDLKNYKQGLKDGQNQVINMLQNQNKDNNDKE